MVARPKGRAPLVRSPTVRGGDGDKPCHVPHRLVHAGPKPPTPFDTPWAHLMVRFVGLPRHPAHPTAISRGEHCKRTRTGTRVS